MFRKNVLRDCIHVCWLLYKFSPGEGEFKSEFKSNRNTIYSPMGRGGSSSVRDRVREVEPRGGSSSSVPGGGVENSSSSPNWNCLNSGSNSSSICFRTVNSNPSSNANSNLSSNCSNLIFSEGKGDSSSVRARVWEVVSRPQVEFEFSSSSRARGV